MLAAEQAQSDMGNGVHALLAALGPDGAAGAPLRTVLARLDWITPLPNPAAPSYVYLAGSCRSTPIGGGGATALEAAWKLAGEAAETLAQSAQPRASTAPALPAINQVWAASAGGTRLAAIRLSDGAEFSVPSCAALTGSQSDTERRADAPPRSLGLAAGNSPETARLSGLLELIERDAAAHWWMQGQRPSALDPADIAPAAAQLESLRARAPEPGRKTTLLRLASRTGIPVICALSLEPDGRGLVTGFKAAPDIAEAAHGAVLEMMQMEIALIMARHRAAQGGGTPGDSGALTRAALEPATFPAFAAAPAAHTATPGETLAEIVPHLAGLGISVYAADLPQPAPGLFVSKVFAEGLTPFPGGMMTAAPQAPGREAPLL